MPPLVLMLKIWLKKCALYVGIYGISYFSVLVVLLYLVFGVTCFVLQYSRGVYLVFRVACLVLQDGCDVDASQSLHLVNVSKRLLRVEPAIRVKQVQ